MTEVGLFTVCSLFHKQNAFSLDSIRAFFPFPEIAHSINLLSSRHLNNAFLFTESFFSFNVIHNKKSQRLLFFIYLFIFGVLTSKIDKELSFFTQLVVSLSCTSRKARSYQSDRKGARAVYTAPAQHKVDLSYNSVSCIHPRKH